MTDYERTEHNPLLALGGVATGFQFITPCCTASVDEFRMPDGSTMLIGSVAGHGFGKPWAGTVLNDINDQGTIVYPDGKHKARYYDASKESE